MGEIILFITVLFWLFYELEVKSEDLEIFAVKFKLL